MDGQKAAKMPRLDNNGSDHFPHFATTAIHVGQDPDRWTSKAVVPLISLSTTFKQESPGEPFPYEYSRGGNPTRDVFEECVAALEGAKYGIATSSGLAAQSVVAQILESGDHIVCMNDVYGGTYRYFARVIANFGIKSTFIDVTDYQTLRDSIQESTKMVWVETPTNPLLRLVDIKAVVDLVKKIRSDILVVVDNTFMSPYFQRPLDFGCDIVYHSVTKYLNGHSDVTMGIVCTSDDALAKKMRFLQMGEYRALEMIMLSLISKLSARKSCGGKPGAAGAVPSPFDCYLANRGVKTLHIRMREHERNALAVAQFLSTSPHIDEVIYPGLPSHPQHELAKKQCKGFSGMISFRIKGNLENSKKLFKALKLFTLAESLGGYESLVELPYSMTHASIPIKERVEMGITDTLVRLSVGLEDTQDLIDDLEQALKASQDV